MSREGKRGFLAAAASAFLRLRQQHQRLRAAAVLRLTRLARLRVRHRNVPRAGDGATMPRRVPSLSIVIMVVGSRGDIQPFIPIARRLAQEHRVRVATHREFRALVEHAGLEFFPLAGDPRALMEYIVKTGGRIVPTGLRQLVEDVPRQRAMVAEILASTWRACTEPDPDRPDAPPFRADLILANPPSYGHIHCAEALRIPLHMIFTMPWSPTAVVPHPFACLAPEGHSPVQNFLSYGFVNAIVWSGMSGLVNAFREDTLQLPPISWADGASLFEDHQVPFTYLWPSSLLAKPKEWGPHIALTNFVFYEQATTYEPSRALMDFLAAGEPPIYVGFGSVVVEDPAALRQIIFTALDKAGARGIVSEGWGHLGGGAPPSNVFVIGDCPHDWLFPRCQAVCHHGGAGTTAAGIRAGRPTVVVPFFGDQFLWGRIVAGAGAGPPPIPIHRLESATLAAAFEMCRRPDVRERAHALGVAVREIDAVELTVQSVYRHLPLSELSSASDQRAPAGRPALDVDWSARAGHGIAMEIGELLGDAAQAVHAGLLAIMPHLAPPRLGTISEVATEDAPDGRRLLRPADEEGTPTRD